MATKACLASASQPHTALSCERIPTRSHAVTPNARANRGPNSGPKPAVWDSGSARWASSFPTSNSSSQCFRYHLQFRAAPNVLHTRGPTATSISTPTIINMNALGSGTFTCKPSNDSIHRQYGRRTLRKKRVHPKQNRQKCP